MNIELVVFDIAGTTVKDKGEITRAFIDAMKTFGYDIPEKAVSPLMGYKKTEAIKMMLDEYEPEASLVTEELITEIHAEFQQRMLAAYREDDAVEALPYAEEIFSFLRKQGIRIGLDTGFSHEIASVIMEKTGWLKDGKVDYMVFSDEVPRGRPYPFMINRMMELAGIADPAKVVKVGDTESDINEGFNAKCRYSIGITTGAFTEDELKPFEPSFIIHHLAELEQIISAVTE